MDNLITCDLAMSGQTSYIGSIKELRIYCRNITGISGTLDTTIDMPTGYSVLGAIVTPRDNVVFGESKFWLRYIQSDNSVVIRSDGAQSNYSGMQLLVLLRKR